MNFGQVSAVEDDHTDGELLVVSYGDSKPSKEWVLDCGCTFHTCPNHDWFSTYKVVSKGAVLMGNDSPCKIGISKVIIKMFDGITLGDVKHDLDLKKNLISLSAALDSKGHKYTGEGRALKVRKGALIVMKGQKRTANLYVLQGTTIIGDVVVASKSMTDCDVTRLWHMRLGNMSENGMTELSRRGLLDGQSTSKLKFCEHCVFEKQR